MKNRVFAALVAVLLLSVAVVHAASAVTLSTSVEQEIIAGQTVRIVVDGFVVEMKTGSTQAGEFTSNIPGREGQKLYGAVRLVDYKVLKGKAKMALEKVETLSGNVKNLPKVFEKPAEVICSNWNDNLVLADEVPLPENSFWEIRQQLFLDGQKIAQFRIRLTPDSIRMFAEPLAAPTDTLSAIAR